MAPQLKNANEWTKQSSLKYQTGVFVCLSKATNLLNVNDNSSPFHRNVTIESGFWTIFSGKQITK